MVGLLVGLWPSMHSEARAARGVSCVLLLAAAVLSLPSIGVAWRCDGEVQSPTPARLQLHSLEGADPLAVCNDGTPAKYYLRGAESRSSGSLVAGPRPSSRLWLVYLAGGAWCSSAQDCRKRWEGEVYPNYDCRLPPGQLENRCFMSSKDYPSECPKAGIFDESEENPLAQANLVYIPYCSSDAWLGDVPPASEDLPWHFRGQQIVRATLAALIHEHGLGAGTEPHTLLFGGGSAGARGAMAWLDLVPSLVPETVQVLGFLDSPYVIDEPPMPESGYEPDFGEQARRVIAMVSPRFPSLILNSHCC